MNLVDCGFIPTMMPEDVNGTPARITAVHKERYELICEYGHTYGRLKTSIYYLDGLEAFPTTGDFVLINYNPHTTTHRQLIRLPNGVMIIDTPGMRELGMWDVSTGLGEAFSDVESYFGRCKFNDCRLQTEPGCAVRAAVKSGELPNER